jgi:cytochrome P450
MKSAFIPFGAGARVCIGLHLAMMELMLGVFVFFKTCPKAKLAASTTDASMAIENYFLIAPKSHRCEITLR